MMDGKTRLKHVEHLTETNKLRNVASCWLYSSNVISVKLVVHHITVLGIETLRLVDYTL